MKKKLSNLYSFIYPKPDGSEYNIKELIGRFIVFGSLIGFLVFSVVRAFSLFQVGTSPTFWSTASQVATVLYTVLTVLILCVAWKGVRHNNDLRSADFAHRFKSDFCKPITYELFDLFSWGSVEYVPKSDVNSMPHFKIISRAFEKEYHIDAKINRKVLDKVLVSEFKAHMLDHFEDLSVWLEKEIISIDYIMEGYSDYIITLAENEAVKQFLLGQSKTDSFEKMEYYNGFYDLYKQVKALSQKLTENSDK